jgi:hypothetical protein
MIQNLLFMTPENGVVSSPPQATMHKPPAVSSPSPGFGLGRFPRVRFAASVAGNTIGFAGILASCWLSLQVLQSWM